MQRLSSSPAPDLPEAKQSAALRREAELVAAIRARDMPAFDRLYDEYERRLTRFLTNLIHRPALVEEIVNDTMLIVWERIDSFAGASRLSTWIFGIAYRTAMKALRRNDAPVEAAEGDEQASDAPSPEELAGRDILQRELHRALQGLSAEHRAVIDLTYFHEMGYRDIAEVMGCPVDTVKTRMFHARRKLKLLLSGVATDWI